MRGSGTPKEILSLVQQALTDAHISGRVLEDEVRQDQTDKDWWYIPILSPQESKAKMVFYEALAELENNIRKSRRINILFIPAAPGDK